MSGSNLYDAADLFNQAYEAGESSIKDGSKSASLLVASLLSWAIEHADDHKSLSVLFRASTILPPSQYSKELAKSVTAGVCDAFKIVHPEKENKVLYESTKEDKQARTALMTPFNTKTQMIRRGWDNIAALMLSHPSGTPYSAETVLSWFDPATQMFSVPWDSLAPVGQKPGFGQWFTYEWMKNPDKCTIVIDSVSKYPFCTWENGKPSAKNYKLYTASFSQLQTTLKTGKLFERTFTTDETTHEVIVETDNSKLAPKTSHRSTGGGGGGGTESGQPSGNVTTLGRAKTLLQRVDGLAGEIELCASNGRRDGLTNAELHKEMVSLKAKLDAIVSAAAQVDDYLTKYEVARKTRDAELQKQGKPVPQEDAPAAAALKMPKPRTKRGK